MGLEKSKRILKTLIYRPKEGKPRKGLAVIACLKLNGIYMFKEKLCSEWQWTWNESERQNWQHSQSRRWGNSMEEVWLWATESSSAPCEILLITSCLPCSESRKSSPFQMANPTSGAGLQTLRARCPPQGCELPTLWKSLLYCKNNSAFVLCVILTILANKYQVPNYKHFIWMNVFNLHRNPLNQVLFLSAFAKEEAKSETAKKLLEVIQPGSDRARIPMQIRRLESPRA